MNRESKLRALAFACVAGVAAISGYLTLTDFFVPNAIIAAGNTATDGGSGAYYYRWTYGVSGGSAVLQPMYGTIYQGDIFVPTGTTATLTVYPYSVYQNQGIVTSSTPTLTTTAGAGYNKITGLDAEVSGMQRATVSLTGVAGEGGEVYLYGVRDIR